jgi:surface polysaccharide O-acyltransferase-like enzyme
MMLCLHLFNRGYEGLFTPIFFIGTTPLSYYISLFSDACVPIFLFIRGYGLYFNYTKEKQFFFKNNLVRVLKLYLNYWIVLVLFTLVLGTLIGKEGYPGSLTKFILNFVGLENSYNGAWWFFFTYILLSLSSPFIFRACDYFSIWILISFSLIFYLIAFYFRVYNNDLFTSAYLGWFFRQIYLYGTFFLPFMFGALVLKEGWHSKFNSGFSLFKYKSFVALSGIFILIGIHGIIPNFIIAPFLAVPFIFLWNQLTNGIKTERFLLWLSAHATNLWLVHMFFYMIYFKSFIYFPKYPLLIFVNLLFWSVLSSYLINIIYHPILNFLNKKLLNSNETSLHHQRD